MWKRYNAPVDRESARNAIKVVNKLFKRTEDGLLICPTCGIRSSAVARLELCTMCFRRKAAKEGKQR